MKYIILYKSKKDHIKRTRLLFLISILKWRKNFSYENITKQINSSLITSPSFWAGSQLRSLHSLPVSSSLDSPEFLFFWICLSALISPTNIFTSLLKTPPSKAHRPHTNMKISRVVGTVLVVVCYDGGGGGKGGGCFGFFNQLP